MLSLMAFGGAVDPNRYLNSLMQRAQPDTYDFLHESESTSLLKFIDSIDSIEQTYDTSRNPPPSIIMKVRRIQAKWRNDAILIATGLVNFGKELERYKDAAGLCSLPSPEGDMIDKKICSKLATLLIVSISETTLPFICPLYKAIDKMRVYSESTLTNPPNRGFFDSPLLPHFPQSCEVKLTSSLEYKKRLVSERYEVARMNFQQRILIQLPRILHHLRMYRASVDFIRRYKDTHYRPIKHEKKEFYEKDLRSYHILYTLRKFTREYDELFDDTNIKEIKSDLQEFMDLLLTGKKDYSKEAIDGIKSIYPEFLAPMVDIIGHTAKDIIALGKSLKSLATGKN